MNDRTTPCTAQCEAVAMVREIPDGQVRRQATFYCWIGNTMDGHLSFRSREKAEFFPPARDPEWMIRTSPHYTRVPMPDAVGPDWSHYRLDIEPDQLRPFTAPLQLVSDCIGRLADFCTWPPFGLVSAQARSILIAQDPESSLFLPAQLYHASGAHLDETWFHWLPRHRLIHAPTTTGAAQGARASLPFPGPFSKPVTAAQLLHNAPLRDYLGRLSVWGMGMDHIRFAFNAPTFNALRQARLTGLVENTAEFSGDRKLHESIGHIP